MAHKLEIDMTATAQLTTTTAATASGEDGSNEKGRLAKMNTMMTNLGKAEASGVAARPMAAAALVDGAFASTVLEGDAEALYDRYQAGLGKVAAQNPNVSAPKSNGRTAQISKFRAFIKLGMLPDIDGPALMVDAARIRGEIEKAGGDEAKAGVKPAFDALLDVARAQVNEPTVQLTEDQIRACVMKKTPEEKAELDKIIAAYKAARKLEETIPCPISPAPSAQLADWIKSLDGNVPPVTDDEKAQAKFMADATKMGFVVTKPLMITAE